MASDAIDNMSEDQTRKINCDTPYGNTESSSISKSSRSTEAGSSGRKEVKMQRTTMKTVQSRKRHVLSVIASILKAAQQHEARRTRLMRRSKLNYNQLLQYLPFLTDRGLLEERSWETDGGEMIITYRTTEAGVLFVERYELLKGLFGTENKLTYVFNEGSSPPSSLSSPQNSPPSWAFPTAYADD